MSRYTEVKEILKKESEEWLAYLYGQQLNNLKHLKDAKPRLTGKFLLSLSFFYHLLRSVFRTLTTNKEKKISVDYYIYAGSSNQAASLAGTAESLIKRKALVRLDSDNAVKLNKVNTQTHFNQQDAQISDLIISTALFITHAPSLYKRLSSTDENKVKNYFNIFCSSYFYLTVFYRLLKVYTPKYVIVANDHNVDCRSLIAVAKHLDIKTVYMQHASVSNLFPALTMDYAFLDGESALNTYRECMNNLPSTHVNKVVTKVFLSGQKKRLSTVEKQGSKKTGLAINTLDNTQACISLVNKLISHGIVISLRWHPGQNKGDILQLKEAFHREPNVCLIDPKQQSINNYLAELDYLVSGNSSIHLEAAIAGVIPIYYVLQPAEKEDYYGYVKNGIAIHAPSFKSLLEDLTNEKKPALNIKAVQYYSATYGTKWHGKEGELVASSLMRLNTNDGNKRFYRC